MDIIKSILENTVLINIIFAIIWGFMSIKLNNYIFKKMDKGRNMIHLKFFSRFVKGIIIIIAIFAGINGFHELDKLYGLAFGSSVVITAVLGIIGKDTLEDVLAGIMISIYRPFNIGDRVLLSDIDKPCVVDDMTGRHVVLKTMDNICYIIPNSEINNRIVLNTSYRHGNLRGTFLKFQISYSSDIRLAIHLIREAVRECPHTVPNNEKNMDLDGYGDVYFMGFNKSAYELETTIWTENETDNFLACSEVRIAVVEQFRDNGIEIPYDYINVISKDEKTVTLQTVEPADNVGKRNVKIRTDRVEITDFEKGLLESFEKSEKYSEYFDLDKKDSLSVRLITEELLSFSRKIFPDLNYDFWLSGTAERVKVHVLVKNVSVSNSAADELLALSTSDSINMNAMDKIKYSVYSCIRNIGKNSSNDRLWNSDDAKATDKDLEREILLKLADSINIGTRDNNVHIVAYKNFPKKRNPGSKS